MTETGHEVAYACIHLVPAILWGIVGWDAGRARSDGGGMAFEVMLPLAAAEDAA